MDSPGDEELEDADKAIQSARSIYDQIEEKTDPGAKEKVIQFSAKKGSLPPESLKILLLVYEDPAQGPQIIDEQFLFEGKPASCIAQSTDSRVFVGYDWDRLLLERVEHFFQGNLKWAGLSEYPAMVTHLGDPPSEWELASNEV